MAPTTASEPLAAPSRRGALAGALAAASLSACGRAERADTVSLWAMDVEGENAKAILPTFQRRSGLAVDLQWLPWTAAHQKLLTAYAGGTLPDVYMLSNGWAAEFGAVRAAAPLPPAAAPALEDQFAGVLDALSVGGRPVAVPWTVDTSVQYFRRDLLADAGYDSPPVRLDDWRQMLRGLKRRRPDSFGVLMQLNWPDHLIAIASQQPEPLLRDRQSRGAFRSEGFRWALAFYQSLFDEGLAPKVTSIEAADPVGELARGFVALYPAGAWTRADLNRRTDLLPRERWGVAPMPGREGPGAAVVAGASLALSPHGRASDRALQLIGYLNDPDTQARFFQVAGVLPTKRSAWRAPALRTDPIMATFAGQLTRARALPNIPEWPRITTEVQLVAERMVRGQLTLHQGVTEMDRTADALLEKRRWLLDRGRLA